MANIFDQFHTPPASVPQGGGNIFDQFHAPTPTGVQNAQREAETSASPSASAVSPVPMPQPRPDAAPPRNIFEQFDPPRFNPAQSGIDPTIPAPRENPKDLRFDTPFNDEQPPVPGAPPGSFMKGLATTFLEQNPKMVGAGLRSLGIASGVKDVDPTATVLQNLGADIEGWAQDPGAYKMSGIQMTDIRSLEDFQKFVGETVGQAVGSSALSVIPSIAGAAAGGRLGGRTGAVAGAGIGATAGSFPAAQGEVFLALKQAGIDDATAAKNAIPAAVVIAGLDAFTPAGLVSKLGGREAVKDEAKKFILRRIAEAAAKGAGKEGVTEGLQEAVKELDVAITADKDFWTKETALNIINATGAGAIGGGAIMAPTGIAQNKVSTPASPEEVAQVAQETAGSQPQPSPTEAQPSPVATQPPQPQENISFSLGKGDVFYSPTKKWVEERGQNIATAEQWENTLRNAPGVKQEEIRDLGLDTYLADMKERGQKVTKGDLVRELEERAITLEERELSNSNFDTWDSLQNERTARIYQLGDQDPTVFQANGLINDAHPGVQQIIQEFIPRFNETDARTRNTPAYEAWTLPGEKQGYTELLLHLPQQVDQPSYEAPHFGTVKGNAGTNLLAHTRITERMDRDGVPVAMIEEIQSDWHQAGRKQGYASNDPVVKEKALTAFENWRSLQRSGASTAAITAAWQNYQKAAESLQGPPNAPFKSSWDELTFKRVLRWAADKGYRRIAIANSESLRNGQGANWSAEQLQGNKVFYDQKMPSLMKKWAKRLGGRVVETKFTPDQTFGQQRVIEDNPNAAQGGLPYQVVNVTANEVENYFFTKEEAQEYIDFQKGMQDTVVPAPGFLTIELPEGGVEMVQSGLPMYSRNITSIGPSAEISSKVEMEATTQPLLELAQQFAPALESLARTFKMDKKLKFFIHENDIVLQDYPRPGQSRTMNNTFGVHWTNWGSEWHQIHINVGMHKSAAEIWATIVHEFGHAIQYEHYNMASPEVKTSIQAAYNEYLEKLGRGNNATGPVNDPNFRKVLALRDNFVAWLRWDPRLTPTQKLSSQIETKYWVSFEEWFAEQVARWALTDKKPLTTVEKFFSGMAKTLMKFWAEALDKFGIPFRPAEAIQKYLDSFHTGTVPFARDINKANEFLTQKDNQAAMGDQEAGVPMQPETAAIRERLNAIFEGGWFKWPFKVRQAVAYADKFNLMYKWALGLHQVAQRNPHILKLQQYAEMISVAQLTKQQIIAEPHEVIKDWTKLGEKRSDDLAQFIDDLQNMVYLTPAEVQAKVVRNPTPAEVQALVAKYKLDAQQLRVFNGVRKTFSDYLTRFEAVLMKEANKITDPVARQARIEAAALQIAALRNRPYFPAMRFGNYTITVRNAANSVIHFETFERKSVRDAAAKEMKSKYGAAVANMQLGYLAEQAQPFMGVPTKLLELMGEKLSLTTQQRDALEQLKFEMSPAQSFKHRFQHKRRVAGYSTDFRRAYANYFLHGANHMMRVMYADELRSLSEEVRKETRQFDATKRHQIANYLSNHLEAWLSPRSDWMMIRSIGFLYALAFTPAAAAQNLTQTIMTTYPFLASQFGDAKAVGTLMRVLGDVQSYHKRGKLETLTGYEYEALSRGIKEGVITEALAPEIAGIAEGQNFKGAGGAALEQMWTKTMELGSKMFELAEQFNRRIVFRATLKLAQAQPNSKYVRDMRIKHSLKVDQLKAETNWTDEQIGAYVAALDATHETQFRYGREFAPRFMRSGATRSVLMFKTFITSYIAFLGAYPGARYRSLLLLGFLGGMMAMPGAEDLKGVIQALAWRLFGKDYDVEKELRKLIINFVGEDENGRQVAEMVLHGSARRGYGIPAFMDMVGSTVLTPRDIDPQSKAFRDYIPAPTFDRSKAISAGTLLPVELGKLFGPPTQDPAQTFTDQTQKALGPVLGLGVAAYKTITNERLDWDDFKRYEKMVPRALGNASKAYRYGFEGRERGQDGSTIVTYNPRDTEQLAEIAGVLMGYQPLRQSLKWDTVIAQRNAVKLWDIQRDVLMRQFYNAAQGKDQGEINRMKEAIDVYNRELPPEAKGKAITRDTLSRSMQSRARSQQAREADSSVRKSDVPIMRKVQELYPESRATTRRVQ